MNTIGARAAFEVLIQPMSDGLTVKTIPISAGKMFSKSVARLYSGFTNLSQVFFVEKMICVAE